MAASNSYAVEAAAEGHPITTVYPEDGTFLIASPTAVVKGSPHPNAAKLFAEYLLSDEQQKLIDGEKSGSLAQPASPSPTPTP